MRPSTATPALLSCCLQNILLTALHCAAIDIGTCRRILAAATAAGVVFAVAENAQFIPDVVKAKELIGERHTISRVPPARSLSTLAMRPQIKGPLVRFTLPTPTSGRAP